MEGNEILFCFCEKARIMCVDEITHVYEFVGWAFEELY
jgi:hypothetical protein